jgi:rod shape-determining protein MreB
MGRTPVGLTTVRPIRDGVITDLQSDRAFIVAILRMAMRHPWERIRLHAAVGVPAGATALEQRGLIEEAGVLANRSCRVAGDEMTLALLQYLRQEHQLMVGELTAEDIKVRLRDAAAERQPLVIEGRDVLTSRPRLMTLDPRESPRALRPTVDGIVDALTGCLEDLPPQAVGDIMHEGVIAFGGGSLLAGFQQRLEEEFGFSVHHAARPLTCVAE